VNICCICSADGVLEACGSWYCMEHYGEGFLDVARNVALLARWDQDSREEFIGALANLLDEYEVTYLGDD